MQPEFRMQYLFISNAESFFTRGIWTSLLIPIFHNIISSCVQSVTVVGVELNGIGVVAIESNWLDFWFAVMLNMNICTRSLVAEKKNAIRQFSSLIICYQVKYENKENILRNGYFFFLVLRRNKKEIRRNKYCFNESFKALLFFSEIEMCKFVRHSLKLRIKSTIGSSL